MSKVSAREWHEIFFLNAELPDYGFHGVLNAASVQRRIHQMRIFQTSCWSCSTERISGILLVFGGLIRGMFSQVLLSTLV
jgi:hypothetical protein